MGRGETASIIICSLRRISKEMSPLEDTRKKRVWVYIYWRQMGTWDGAMLGQGRGDKATTLLQRGTR